MSFLTIALMSAQLSSCAAPDLTQGPAPGDRIAYDLNGFNVANEIEAADQGVVRYRQVSIMPGGGPQPPVIMHTSAAGLLVTAIDPPSGPGMTFDVDPAMLVERVAGLTSGESVRLTTTLTAPQPSGGLQSRTAEIEITLLGCGQEQTPGGVFDVAVFEVVQSSGGAPSVSEVAWAPALGWPVRSSSGGAILSYTGAGS
ncbi:MAG: hypothetical protein RIA71_11415 [Oceanicaulis sp.]